MKWPKIAAVETAIYNGLAADFLMLAAGGGGMDALTSAEVFLFEDFHPALQRAWRKVEEGMVGFVNIRTDLSRPRHDGALL